MLVELVFQIIRCLLSLHLTSSNDSMTGQTKFLRDEIMREWPLMHFPTTKIEQQRMVIKSEPNMMLRIHQHRAHKRTLGTQFIFHS